MGGYYGGTGYRPGASGYSAYTPSGGLARPGLSEGLQRMAPGSVPTAGGALLDFAPDPKTGAFKLAPLAEDVAKASARAAARNAIGLGLMIAGETIFDRLKRERKGAMPWVATDGYETICGVQSASEVFRCVNPAFNNCGTNAPPATDYVGEPTMCLGERPVPVTGIVGYGVPDPQTQWRRITWSAEITQHVRPLHVPQISVPRMHCEPYRDFEGVRERDPGPGPTRPIFPIPASGTGPSFPPDFGLPSPADPGEQEKKPGGRAQAARGYIYPRVGAATEAKDLMECIHDSLPKECQAERPRARWFDPGTRRWRSRVLTDRRGVPLKPSLPAMAAAIYDCAGSLTSDSITRECLKEMLKDAAFGILNAGIVRQSMRHGPWKCRPVGIGAGPAM
jgi:hypothetical protein